MSAFGGKADMTRTCPMSAFDPKRTFAVRAPSIAPYVTLDDRLNVIPLTRFSGRTHAAARVHHHFRRHGGKLAPQRACAAAYDTGGRFHDWSLIPRFGTSCLCLPTRSD